MKAGPMGSTTWVRSWARPTRKTVAATVSFSMTVSCGTLTRSSSPGWMSFFRSARGINNVGQIVTSAVLPDDSRHAYLLTPGLLHLDAPDPGIAGMVNTYTAGDAVPGEMVDFYEGSVPLPTAIDECSAIVQIKDPTTLGSAVAGPDGTASIEIFVSGKESGETVFIQAGEWTDCVPSNLVRHTFQ